METEKKARRAGAKIAALVLCLAMLMSMVGCDANPDATNPPADSTATAAATDTVDGTDTTDGTDSTDGTESTEPAVVYTGTDEDVLAAKDQVITEVGNYKLTNQMMNIYYWNQFYNFMNTYGSYAVYYGLDYTAPLYEQEISDGMTWEQYFMETGISTWVQYAALATEAEANGFEMPEDAQASLDALPDDIAATAEENGYESVEALVEYEYGPGVTVEDYVEYSRMSYIAYSYFEQIYEANEPTDESVLETYYEENADSLTALADVDRSMAATVDVRHILIAPSGGTLNEETYETEYTDEEWAAAQEEAERVYQEWKDGGATEELFSELAAEYTADSNGSDGGLYEDVYPGQMVTEFNDWCFDLSRQPGDTDIVQTSYGYHIMYFVEASEETYWHETVLQSYMNDWTSEFMDGLLANFTYEVNYDNIVLSELSMVAES